MKLFRNMGPYEWHELFAALHGIVGGAIVGVVVYFIIT